MQTLVGIEELTHKLTNPVLTMGNFDGVHRGHQALFKRVRQWAAQLNGQSVVLTFHPHPLEVLFPDKSLDIITSHERKLQLIAACGIDVTIVIPFTKELAQISAHDFVRTLLVDKIGIKAMVVGYDTRFGRNREGNILFLKEMGEKYGFEVEVVSELSVEDTIVSSTAVRQLLKQGDMQEAGRLMGRPYEVTGKVVTGRGRGGRLIGFPTANIRFRGQTPPRPGVYVVEVELEGQRYGGAANLGYNPTFGDTPFTLEVHIFDFDRDIYGSTLRVYFLERLRDERRFAGIEELIQQITQDVACAREILAQRRSG